MKKELEKKDEPAKVQPKPREVVVQGEQSSTFWPLPIDIAPVFERLASGGLAIVLVIFMLMQREDLRNRLIRLIGYGHLTLTTKALEEASQRISRYLLMQSIINTSFGIAVGIALYFIGLPYALLWGFLAAMLRFIPYVGPWAATIMPSALSLIVFEGWMWPALVVAVFLVLELVNNMILEPLLYGESAGVSEVGLLIAVAFWTWLWGPDRTDPRHAAHGLCRRVEQICPPVGFHQRADERRASDEIGHKLLSETIGWGPGRGGRKSSKNISRPIP